MYVDDYEDEVFSEVIALGRDNKKTLGPYPDTGFQKARQLKELIIAKTESNEVAGYLLYRIRKYDNACGITHLCVSEKYRSRNDHSNQKISDALIQVLQKKEATRSGIFLCCRTDYTSASKVWKRNGFTVITSKRGRSKKGTRLNYWWLSLNTPQLFSYFFRDTSEKIYAVIDRNILLDIINPPQNSQSESSLALLADWLENEVSLCYTPDIQEDCSKKMSPEQQHSISSFLKTLLPIPHAKEKYLEAMENLKNIFVGEREQDNFDRSHIAYTIAAQIPYFITRDSNILSKANAIKEALNYPLTVIHPASFVAEIDEKQRTEAYQPYLLEEANIKVTRITKDDVSDLFYDFGNHFCGERKTYFNEKIHQSVIYPNENDLFLFSTEAHNDALVILNFSDIGICKIPLVRVSTGSKATTFACKLVDYIIRTAAKKKCAVIEINDSLVSSEIESILEKFGFLESIEHGKWIKVNCYEQVTLDNVKTQFQNASSKYNLAMAQILLRDILENPKSFSSNNAFWALEEMIWPGRIKEAELPCYIIPIQPQWAAQIVNHRLCTEELFPRNQELALNVESVFYDQPKRQIQSPARILWYVSQGKGTGYSQVKAIHAYSTLISIEKGEPKELLKRNSRLGIWKWNDVKSKHGKTMSALRFTKTEIFNNPIPYKKVMDLFKKYDIKNSNISSVEVINQDIFEEVYRLGFNYNG